MPSIGPLELAIILVIVLLIFGPKRLPGLGKQLGSGMREFKDSITGRDSDDEPAAVEQPAAPAQVAPAPAPPAPAPLSEPTPAQADNPADDRPAAGA